MFTFIRSIKGEKRLILKMEPNKEPVARVFKTLTKISWLFFIFDLVKLSYLSFLSDLVISKPYGVDTSQHPKVSSREITMRHVAIDRPV